MDQDQGDNKQAGDQKIAEAEQGLRSAPQGASDVPPKGAPVFSEKKPDKKMETPEWLMSVAKSAQGKIHEVVAPSFKKFSEVLPNLRAKKPTATELGQDPSSLIQVTPSLEVVTKADESARKKMIASGYDPDTGRKLEKGEMPSTGPVDAKTEIAKQAAGTPSLEKALFEEKKVPEAPPAVATPTAPAAPAIPAAPKPPEKKPGDLKGVFGKKPKKTEEAGKKPKKLSAAQEERKKMIEAERLFQEGVASIKDLIAPSSMEVKYDSIQIDGFYAKSFYVFAYPRYLDANWLAPVINFDVTMDISQFIYPISSEQIMKTLKKKVAQMQSSIRIGSEKGRVRDPALETALLDAESLRTEIQRGQEKFFQFALYFTLYAEDEKKLEKISKQLESLLAGKLVLTKRTQLQAEHGFNACLPLGLDELYTIRNMNTGPLSTTFPFTSSDLTSDKGVLYGLNRHNDSLIIFDRFALENANSVVFAKSGAGKSYAVKLEILRLLMMGTDVIVIDPENEYEALSTTVGGSYLRLSLNADRRINPFDLPSPIEGSEPQPGDLLRSNIISLHGLLKLMLGGLNPEEESILDKALIDVYALKGITMELADPSVYEPPTMEDLHQILNSMEGATSLVQRVAKYTTGSYSGIFNKPTNVDLSTGLMVFSIRDLEDALRPIAMYIVLNYIWSKVRSKLKKRILVVDEAWSLMQHEDSAKFLFGLVKRARKYYLGVTTITQDVDDFIKSDYGKPIVTNSSMQLLLKQAPSSVNVLAKVFNLTEGEKYVLLNSGVGQGLFFAGQKHVATQIIASFTEDKIVTTDPEQIIKAREEANKQFKAPKKEATDVVPPVTPSTPADVAPADAAPADTNTSSSDSTT